ncbi:MAG TPA: tyrosine-type recombinase/integrase [Candidatus Dormibacteraeota bacterium]|jgi:integrase|nr:tyrosine-type recombinase/integrase [Candidatus Dormibacteraeota bacterium]
MARRAAGEGTIYQRADGRWVAQLRADGRRLTFYGATRREANEKLLKARRDRAEGVLLAASGWTLGQYLERWLTDVVSRSVRPRTYETAALNVRRLLPYLGRLKLGSLSPAAVQYTYGRLLDRGLSARSVEQVHEVLHRALRQAVLWGLIARNPTDGVAVPRPARREPRVLTEAEIRRLFEATGDHRLYALWVVLATTGLRLGEALGLMWDDLDAKTGRLHVRRALQWQRGRGPVLTEPKTRRSRRVVYLAPSVVRALADHRHRQEEERLLAGSRWEGIGLIFCTRWGRPIRDTYLSAVFHRTLARAGLPRVRIHDLRHTAASHLLARGVHPKVVQELLGHSTIALTLDTYSHVLPALHADAVPGHMEVLFDADGRQGGSRSLRGQG